MDDEIINLKAVTFDIIMAKTQLIEELNALDRIINQNVKKIQELELQQRKTKVEERTSAKIHAESNPLKTNSQPVPVETNNHVVLVPIEPTESTPLEVNSQPTPNQVLTPPGSTEEVPLVPVESEEIHQIMEKRTPGRPKKKLKINKKPVSLHGKKLKTCPAYTEEEDKYLTENWGKLSVKEMMKELGRTGGSLRSHALRLKITPCRGKLKPWMEEDDRYLTENWGKISVKEMMKELGRTEGSVCTRAKRLKLTQGMNFWTEEEDKYLTENWGVLHTREIMKELGRSKYAVETRAIKTLKLAKKIIRYWSKEEDDYLKENVNKLSRGMIAKNMGRSVSGVVSRIYRLKLLSDPVLPDEESEKTPISHTVLQNEENGTNEDGQDVPAKEHNEKENNEDVFLDWIESNNISDFDIDDFINQSQITRGRAEKIISQQIRKGYINQMGKASFVVNMGRKNKRKNEVNKGYESRKNKDWEM